MSGHTPGPWKACCAGSCRTGIVWAIPGDIVVAAAMSVDDESYTHGEGVSDFEVLEANARLIAAAPELLAELERSQAQLVAYAVGPGPDHVDAQLQAEANAAAIAKARGGK